VPVVCLTGLCCLVKYFVIEDVIFQRICDDCARISLAGTLDS
jgi:hypothetical protein